MTAILCHTIYDPEEFNFSTGPEMKWVNCQFSFGSGRHIVGLIVVSKRSFQVETPRVFFPNFLLFADQIQAAPMLCPSCLFYYK